MGLTALAVFCILEGINLAIVSFMGQVVVGILLLVVGAIMLFERLGFIQAQFTARRG